MEVWPKGILWPKYFGGKTFLGHNFFGLGLGNVLHFAKASEKHEDAKNTQLIPKSGYKIPLQKSHNLFLFHKKFMYYLICQLIQYSLLDINPYSTKLLLSNSIPRQCHDCKIDSVLPLSLVSCHNKKNNTTPIKIYVKEANWLIW